MEIQRACQDVIVQICSYLLTPNGDIEQAQDQQTNEVVTDHVYLSICSVEAACSANQQNWLKVHAV